MWGLRGGVAEEEHWLATAEARSRHEVSTNFIIRGDPDIDFVLIRYKKKNH